MKIINTIQEFDERKEYNIGDKFLFENKIVKTIEDYSLKCEKCVFNNTKYCNYYICVLPARIYIYENNK